MNQNLVTRWLKDLRFYIILSLILWQPDFTNQIDLGKLGSHMFDDSFQIDHLIGTQSRDCDDHQIWSSSGMNQSRPEAVNWRPEGGRKAIWRWSEVGMKVSRSLSEGARWGTEYRMEHNYTCGWVRWIKLSRLKRINDIFHIPLPFFSVPKNP